MPLIRQRLCAMPTHSLMREIRWSGYSFSVEVSAKRRTHAPKTPWTLIEGNCKRFARIKALDVVIEAIEKAIAEKSR